MKITDNSTAKNEIRPQKVDFNQASITEGHKVPRFTVASARLNLTTSTLDEEEYPFPLENQHGEKDIEFSFYVAPESTSRADEGVRYDLLFWSESRISFDLYYRKLDAKTMEPVTSGVTPELPATATPTKKDNGWYLLGNSGTPISPVQGETKGGVDLHKQFNNATSATFPRLKDLDDSGDYLYEFAVSVTQIGTVTNRKAWSGKVNFYVNAASAVSGRNLENLANGQTEENWRVFYAEKGMNGGGGSTIGVSTLDGSDTLKLDYDFSNTQVPSFTSGAPTFKVGDSSVEIGVNLTLPGTVYYLIAPVAPEDVTTGISSIRTVVNRVPIKDGDVPAVGTDGNVTFEEKTLSDRELYDYNVVPGVGGSGDPNIEDINENPYTESKWVTAPVVDDVRFPPYTNEQFKKGTYVYSGGGGYEPIKPVISGLLPNQAYFCYMVLMGANPRETSQVYLYTFKTSETSKPRITLDDKRNGEVEISTAYGNSNENSVEADLTWRVFTQTQGQNALKGSTINIPTTDSNSNAIKGYGTAAAGATTKPMTWLEALTTAYDANVAYDGTPPGNAQYGKIYNGFTVFDVFADSTAKRAVEKLVSSPEDAYGKVNSGDAATRITGEYGPYADRADWVTDGTGVSPEPAKYLILVSGHNVNSTTGDGDWSAVNSFAAYDGVVIQDLNPPLLREGTGVGGVINYDPITKELSGYVVLRFDKDVYWRKNGEETNNAVIAGDAAPTGGEVGILYLSLIHI